MVSDPKIEREIVVRWDEVRTVVGLGRINVIAACRLQPDNGVAELEDLQFDAIPIDKWIICRIAPTLGDLLFDVPRERVEILLVQL